MSLPLGPGLWPAFWALGTDITSVSWPASGEMDFMENVPGSGLGPTVIASTLHGGASSSNCYCGANGLSKQYTINDGTTVSAFHTYGAIWSPNMVQFYVDDPTKVFFVRTASDVPAGSRGSSMHRFFAAEPCRGRHRKLAGRSRQHHAESCRDDGGLCARIYAIGGRRTDHDRSGH